MGIMGFVSRIKERAGKWEGRRSRQRRRVYRFDPVYKDMPAQATSRRCCVAGCTRVATQVESNGLDGSYRRYVCDDDADGRWKP